MALGKTSQSWWKAPSEDHDPPYWHRIFLGGTGHPLGLAQSGSGVRPKALSAFPQEGQWSPGGPAAGHADI